jgi:hypothetical protein
LGSSQPGGQFVKRWTVRTLMATESINPARRKISVPWNV